MNKIKDIHNAELIYYMCDNNRIKGPYNIDQLISLYITNQIHDETIHLQCASKYNLRNSWFPIVIPTLERSRDDYLHLESQDPELFDKLIKPILDGDIQQIGPIPADYPHHKTVKLKSCGAKFLSKLGHLLTYFALLIILLHTGMFMICSLCLFTLCPPLPIYALSFMGILVTPCIIVSVLLTQFDDIWNEIQSWMIAYIVWGLISYLLFMIYVIAVYCIENAEGYLDVLNNIVMITLGFDVGEFNVNSIIMSNYFILTDVIRGKKMDVLILMMTPFVASLLPATVIGFIANFILDEKYELDCRQEYLDGDICIESSESCCKIISSHDWNNIYVFMGGLSANILAMWAIIRIFCYIMVHADPLFATYVKRRRKY